MRPCIAGNKIKLAVRPRHAGMQSMVMVQAAEAGKENLLSVGYVIPVLIGIDDDGRGAGDDYPIAYHCNTQGRTKVFILDKDLGRIRDTVPVRILEDHHPVTLRIVHMAVLVVEVPVVYRLGHPDPAVNIHIYIGRVVELWGLSPNHGFQIFWNKKDRPFGEILLVGFSRSTGQNKRHRG